MKGVKGGGGNLSFKTFCDLQFRKKFCQNPGNLSGIFTNKNKTVTKMYF